MSVPDRIDSGSMMKRSFTKSISSLRPLYLFIEKFAESRDFTPKSLNTLHLAGEEIFTNMVKYGVDSSDDIVVELIGEGETAVLRITDHNVRPFDLTSAPEVDILRPKESIRPGGLGIHLIRKMASDVSFEYLNSANVVTVRVKTT